MDDDLLLDIPETHVFAMVERVEGSTPGYATSGLLAVLPDLKQTQLSEILVVSGFTADSALEDVVISPNVITRIWLFQAISEYIARGTAHGAE